MIGDSYISYPDGMPWPVRNGLLIPRVPPGQLRQSIKGSPGWIKTERFTIDAKAEGSVSLEMMRGPMMQAVLEDRFKLAIHRETREVPVYYLIVAKGGSRLQLAKEGSCTLMTPEKGPPQARAPGQPTPPVLCGGFHVSKNGGLDVNGVPLDHLCMLFSLAMDRDVIDRTGLTGTFDIHLELTFAEIGFRGGGGIGSEANDLGAATSASDPSSSIGFAIRKLGLQLQAGKRLAEFIVIDHVEMPTAN